MTIRRAVFLIHLATGCIAGLVILFLSATGFLLAWQKPITAWQERGYRSAPPTAGQQDLPLDRLLAIAVAREGKPPEAVTVAADPRAPLQVDFGRNHRLFLDRCSGAVLGPGALRTRTFFDEVTALHRWFGASPADHATAKLVKGAFDLGLLLMIVTGAILWLPQTWSWRRIRAGMTVRRNLAGRARDWNRHNVIGFWFAAPLALVALTGGILAYGWMTAALYRLTGSPMPVAHRAAAIRQKEKQQRKPAVQVSDGVPLETIFQTAARQFPAWKRLRIVVSHPGAHAVPVSVDLLHGGRPDGEISLTFDCTTGLLHQQTAFVSLSLGGRLHAFTKYIHTGEAGGLAGETAAGLTALAGCFLVWTGLAMALRRWIAATRSIDKSGSKRSPDIHWTAPTRNPQE